MSDWALAVDGAEERGRDPAEELELSETRQDAGDEPAGAGAAVGGERLRSPVDGRGDEEQRPAQRPL